MNIQEGKLLYHLTDIRNIRKIIEKGLLSRSSLESRGLVFTDVADEEILDFRRMHNLNCFVPFHFFAKNPFDGRVQIDNPDIEFVYICIKRSVARHMGFQIIPRHPLNMVPFIIYDYEDGFNNIDWATMENRDYADYECKEICMAESIYLGDLGNDSFFSINVISERSKKYVEDLLDDYGITNIYVNTTPYYFI